jgi:hypothetical protein
VTERTLISHPASMPGAQLELSAEIVRIGATRLQLRYRVRGQIDRVALPTRVPPLRVDGLWKRTCFEAFIAPENRAGYAEINVSPSTEWAAYAFDGYRVGMRPLSLPIAPAIDVVVSADELRVTADLDFGGAEDAPSPWRVGLCAVIADRAGDLSYWALRHPAAKPDFHDAAGFAWRLEGPVG